MAVLVQLPPQQSQPPMHMQPSQQQFSHQQPIHPPAPLGGSGTADDLSSVGRQEGREVRSSKFGLLGLLDVIRMSDRDLNALALGSDLTTFGLNLNSTECLYSSFLSPFADNPMSKEPRFHIPSCYRMRVRIVSCTC